MFGTKSDILADRDDNDFFIMLNADTKECAFTICPAPQNKNWFRAVDTALPSPEDISPLNEEAFLESQTKYRAAGRSLVILLSK
jgi:glycogen operon protein